MPREKAKTLELEDDLSYERRQWRIERFSWVIMLMIIIGAVCGLFGGAGLFLYNKAPLTTTGDTEMEYPRFGRFMSALSLTFRATGTDNTISTISIEEHYLNTMQIDNITPSPEKVEAQNGMLIYSFHGSPRQVSFNLKANSIGMHDATISLTGQEAVQIHQFIYP